MDIARRLFLKLIPLLAWRGSFLLAAESRVKALFLGQGTMAGEVTDSSALLQTRLSLAMQLNADGDLPGAPGVACFEWSTREDFRDAQRTPFLPATAKGDFIVRADLTGLKPNTTYHYRAVFGATEETVQAGPNCSFRTLPGGAIDTPVRFIVGSCMNYNKFLHGKVGKASGPLTATDEDKRLGYPAFEAMRSLHPDFFVGTGDIVYYDNPLRVAKTIPQLRQCWHEQFRFPRLIEFFRSVPAYWSKDDHDFRFNESDNTTDRLPLPQTGIDLFREQLPIAVKGSDKPTYRTHRISRDLQIWLTEGRDYRSPNEMPDGPEKSLWGAAQREWLKATLKASDTRWKILISPTPMVGPDDGKKIDNHADINGYRHEADAFFAWLKANEIGPLIVICGDRHWQYHSIHLSGVEEFACGALNDENARLGVAPGDKNGSDPEARIRQLYTSPTPNGGFLQITAGAELVFEHFDSRGQRLYRAVKSKTAEDATPFVHTVAPELQPKIQFLNPQYLVYAPAGNNTSKLPLLIFLHGAGEVGNDIKQVKGKPTEIWRGIQEFNKGPCIVVAPQCLKTSKGERGIWTPEDLNHFLQHLKATLPVDDRRIYLSGISMGGYGTWAWAAHDPQHFAAIAPIVGGIGREGAKAVTPDFDQWAKNLATIPVHAFVGALDKTVPPERSERMIAAIQRAGGKDAKLTVYPNEGHGAGRIVVASKEYYDWLYSKKRD